MPKHAALAWLWHTLQQEHDVAHYIDAFAGRGIYDLQSDEAKKTNEWRSGVARMPWSPLPASAKPYTQVLNQFGWSMSRAGREYPGSPAIVKSLARTGDKLNLFELHPQEHHALLKNMGRSAQVMKMNGYEIVEGINPDLPSLILLDPSYEVKTEYEQIAQLALSLHQKAPKSIVLVWYPLLEDERQKVLTDALAASTTWQQELMFGANSGYRMVGTGLIVLGALSQVQLDGLSSQTLWLQNWAKN